MTPEPVVSLGPCVLDRIGEAEEAPLIANPDPDLAAIGILGDLRVDVGRDHQDSDPLGRVIRDRSIALRPTWQREHVTFVELTSAFERPDCRPSSKDHEKPIAGVMEVTPVVPSGMDLPDRGTEPGTPASESARTDPAPVRDFVPDVDGVRHRNCQSPTYQLAAWPRSYGPASLSRGE